jgi:hypothetical protein
MVHRQVDARKLPELWADRDRLLQLFENLLGNAIKFTELSGRITVGAVSKGRDVLFWVEDTGCGIAAADVPMSSSACGKPESRRAEAPDLASPSSKVSSKLTVAESGWRASRSTARSSISRFPPLTTSRSSRSGTYLAFLTLRHTRTNVYHAASEGNNAVYIPAI